MRIFCIVAYYRDGSGEPDVLFASNDRSICDAQLDLINQAEPVKKIEVVEAAVTHMTETVAK